MVKREMMIYMDKMVMMSYMVDGELTILAAVMVKMNYTVVKIMIG